MTPRVCVVTVNWNQFEDTCECVDSLITQEGVITDLIVVDNGSTDDSELWLRNKYPNITIIKSKKNIGFAGGFNLGIRLALTRDVDNIMIVNNDTVAEKDMIRKLLGEMSDEKVGVTSPLILYYSDPNRIWSSGGDINPTVLMPIDAHHRDEHLTKPVFRTFLSGCCLLIKKSLIESVGFFDERFFLYFEDLDYCLRIMRSGWRMKVVPSARLLHKVSLSSGGERAPQERYYNSLSTILYYRKHITKRNFLMIFLFRMVSSILWTFRLLFRGQISALWAYWRGLLAGLRKNPVNFSTSFEK